MVILGGGFAGLAAAQALAPGARSGLIDLTLIDRGDQSVFWPLLPDIISGRIAPRNICYPLESLCKARGIRFVQGAAQRIDPAARQIHCDAGPIDYDWLLLACGVEPNWFGRDDLRETLPAFKSVAEAQHVSQGVLRLLDASRPGSPGNLIVVGGGYTGFEAASHAAHLLRVRTALSFQELASRVRITIVELADRPLGNLPPQVASWAMQLMTRFGVEVRSGVTLASMTGDGSALLTDGTRLDNAFALWTAGVTGGPVAASLDAPARPQGRLAVDKYLRLAGHDSIFAAGDICGFTRPDTGKTLAMGVQVTLDQGKLAAGNILRALRQRPLKRYRPVELGSIVPLAPGRAAGKVLGLEMQGRLPYAMHYAMSIARSWGWSNRLGIMRDLLCPRRTV